MTVDGRACDGTDLRTRCFHLVARTWHFFTLYQALPRYNLRAHISFTGCRLIIHTKELYIHVYASSKLRNRYTYPKAYTRDGLASTPGITARQLRSIQLSHQSQMAMLIIRSQTVAYVLASISELITVTRRNALDIVLQYYQTLP